MHRQLLARTAFFCILTLACASALQAQAKPDFTGTWKTNIAKSDFGAMPAPESVTTKIQHKDPKLGVESTSVGDQGEHTITFNLMTDGTETTNQFGPVEIKSKAHWEDKALLIESKAATDNGEITVKEKWTLSDDGKILTLARNFSGPQGDMTQTVVQEKQ